MNKMKTTIATVMMVNVLGIGSLANAHTMSDLAGNYRITSKQSPQVVNLVTLKSNGDITLKQVAGNRAIVCRGQSKISDNLLRSIVQCGDPAVFYRQQIDFSQVRNLNKFQAPVSSDLWGATWMMDFVKIPGSNSTF